MDNNVVNVRLSLTGEEYISELRRKIYEDELIKLNLEFPIKENDIDIRQSYIVKNNDDFEVGFFIRNGSRSNISIEVVSLVLEDKLGKNVLSKVFNFKDNGIIQPFSAKPYVVNFEINDSVNIIDEEDYTIRFDDTNSYKAFSSVETEIENMPLDISFDEEKNIKDFINKLDTLRKDEISVKLYKLAYTNSQGFECQIIIRNGYDKEINFEKLPIAVINDKDTIIARRVFQDSEGGLKVSPNKSIFIKFTFLPNEVLDKNADLSKCRIECK